MKLLLDNVDIIASIFKNRVKIFIQFLKEKRINFTLILLSVTNIEMFQIKININQLLHLKLEELIKNFDIKRG